MMSIKIDKEFKSLIPPLGDEELNQLEANILADGCRDPLVTWNGVLIDGHNRFAICKKHDKTYSVVEMDFLTRDDAKIWIIQNQFGRRNLALFTRGELVMKLEPLFEERRKAILKKSGEETGRGNKKVSTNSSKPLDTRKELSKIGGVSQDTISKTKLISEHADEKTKKQLRNNEVSVNRVARDIKEEQTKKKRTEKRQKAIEYVDVDEPNFFDNVHVGDFREHADKVADGSLSLIFTDPPYDKKSTELFDGLGKFASSKLCDGGSLVCYVGQTQIPKAIESLSANLRYWWTLCCIHSGGANLMNEYGIRCGWKAVLWFVKNTRDNKEDIVSDVMSGGREKSHHDWQQAQSEAEYWVEHLCPKDGIVCDPFLGGGTTVAAAVKLDRRWVAFEKDHEQAVIAMTRVKGAA